MSRSRNEPRLLFSVGGINATHIQHGEERSLTPSGPQTLSLLLVPTSHDDIEAQLEQAGGARPESPELDFYLHLHLPPELDIAMPATTQVYHQRPSSYIIPRWDLGPESGAFTRIEFPKIGTGEDRVSQEDIDTFETILAQCTAFAEKAPVPQARGSKAYNPSDYKPGEGYVGSGADSGSVATGPGAKGEHGQIVLIDEEDGSVIGELSEGYQIDEKAGVRPGEKTPVEIEMPQEGAPNRISVAPISDEYLAMSRHPAYASSTIVKNAAMASRLIVTGSTTLSRAMTSGAQSFSQKTKPVAKPMTFSPAAQERIRKINAMTHGAVGLSAATVGQINKVAQGLGARLGGRTQSKPAPGGSGNGNGVGVDRNGRRLPAPGAKPSILNKSMIAFTTITDSLEESAKQLLSASGASAAHMVKHRYGPDAGQVATHMAGSIRHVSLVFVDATGVSRKAVLKSVAKGMVVGKMPNGQQLLVGDGDGGIVPQDVREKEKRAGEGPGAGASGKLSPPGRSGTPTSALEAARIHANAQSSAASGVGLPPPAYNDLSRTGSRVGDVKQR